MINELSQTIHSKKSEIESCKENLSSLLNEYRLENNKKYIFDSLEYLDSKNMTQDERTEQEKKKAKEIEDQKLKLEQDRLAKELENKKPQQEKQKLENENNKKEFERQKKECLEKYLKISNFLSQTIDKKYSDDQKKALENIINEIQKNSSNLTGDFEKDKQDKNINKLINFFYKFKSF